MKRLLSAILISTLLLCSCGYRFQGYASNPPGGIRTIAVEKVSNATIYTDLTNDLTNGLIQQFNLTKAMKVVPSDMADGILKTAVNSVQIEGAARSRVEDASASRRVTVVASATLISRSTGKTLWKNGGIVSRQTYPVADDQSTVDANLKAALIDVAQDLAQKIHDGMFEDF